MVISHFILPQRGNHPSFAAYSLKHILNRCELVLVMMVHFRSIQLVNGLATVEYLYKLYPESISVAADDQSYPIHYTIRGLNNIRNRENVNEVVKFLLDCNTDVALQKHQDK